MKYVLRRVEKSSLQTSVIKTSVLKNKWDKYETNSNEIYSSSKNFKSSSVFMLDLLIQP